MNLTCPVCRAENTNGPGCRRCRADLSLLIAVEARRDYHLSSARRAVAEGRLDVALQEAGRAEGLRAGPDVCQVRACAYLVAGDFPSAFHEHSAGGRQETSRSA